MDTLTTLLEQAEADRNQALAAFNQARARCDAARAQAAQLAGYRADYHLRWSKTFERGASLEIMRCYQAFSDRLEQAITLQGDTVDAALAAQARASDVLTAHELRVASVRKLMERRTRETQRTADRREQKASDESAMRVARRRDGGLFCMSVGQP
jgi:flagellar protein FliJ